MSLKALLRWMIPLMATAAVVVLVEVMAQTRPSPVVRVAWALAAAGVIVGAAADRSAGHRCSTARDRHTNRTIHDEK